MDAYFKRFVPIVKNDSNQKVLAATNFWLTIDAQSAVINNLKLDNLYIVYINNWRYGPISPDTHLKIVIQTQFSKPIPSFTYSFIGDLVIDGLLLTNIDFNCLMRSENVNVLHFYLS